MDYTSFTTVKNRIQRSPNLCDLFQLLSIETWKRLEYAYIKPRVKVFETTLTQNLIFTLNAYSDQYGLNIDIFEAIDENTNGNDLELIIRYPSEGIEFYAPVQAKKVYRNGRYISMEHGDQIESLIEYAATKHAQALYLLYNYSGYAGLYGHYALPELMGCTLISTQYLFDNYYKKRKGYRDGILVDKWIIPYFDELHPTPAFAWHELVCSVNSIDLYRALISYGVLPPTLTPSYIDIANFRQLNLGFYPIGTVENYGWINLKELPSYIDGRQSSYLESDVRENVESNSDNDIDSGGKEKVYTLFAPKSRIIISKE